MQVTDSVCYDHVGHGFFLEDGNEEGNLLRGNLGLGTKAGSGALVHSDAISVPTGEQLLPLVLLLLLLVL